MKKRIHFRILIIGAIIFFGIQPFWGRDCFAIVKTHTITAKSLTRSGNAEIRGDHVVLFGRGKTNFTWVSYPISAIPFKKFSVEVEVAAMPAENKWPKLGIGLADSNRFGGRERSVDSADWHWVEFGEIVLQEADDEVYFVFTNDYFNPRTREDLNLKIRDIRFHNMAIEKDAQIVSGGRITVKWNTNPEPDIAGYRIHYGLEPGRYTTSIDAGLQTGHTFDVSVGFTYYLAVSAYDSSGRNSPFSQEVVFFAETPGLAYDVNGDGQKNLHDLIVIYYSMGSRNGDRNYNPRADLNNDNSVDENDLSLANAGSSNILIPPHESDDGERRTILPPATSTLYAGDIFNIQLHIYARRKLYGAVAELHFPKDAIEILTDDGGYPDIRRGAFLDKNLPLIASQEAGSVDGISILTIAWSLLGDEREKTGDGPLFSIRARALKPGSHLISWGPSSQMVSFEVEQVDNCFQNAVINVHPTKSGNTVSVSIFRDEER